MSWLEGRVVLPQNPGNRWLRTLAESLARIHALDIHVPYAFESWNGTSPDSRPDWWCSESLWSRAQALTAELPCFDARFIHRDYHPVNVLWEEDRISGIVDWINACMGPVGIDVAHCRLNLALMYGLDTADAFLDAYRAAVRDYRHNACWDMESALSALPDVRPYEPWNDFGLKGLTTELVRTRLEAFVEGAVSAFTSSASPC
jgi:Ser/Thr protein kinase RdoA (MazF antagonist)